MGGGSGGSYSSSPSTLTSNIKDLRGLYPVDSQGRFGTPGRGQDVQHIISKDPMATGKLFFERLSPGGRIKDLTNGKGKISTFRNGSSVVFRPKSSSDGTPALSIVHIGSSKSDEYKIHFIQETGK